MLLSIIIFSASITPSYEALIDSADTCTRNNHWLEASNLYKEALKLYPGSPLNSKIFANIGVCYSNLERFDEALEAFDIALVKEPANVRILSQRATTNILAGNSEAALSDLKMALDVDSLAADPLRMHGQLMIASNDLNTARRDFLLLSEVSPHDPWGAAGLAEIEYMEGRPEESIPLYIKALEIEENPDFRISLITAMLDTYKLKEAEDLIRESIMSYPKTGEFYVMRARLNKILHQNSLAESDKKIAIEYGVDPQIIERFLHSAPR